MSKTKPRNTAKNSAPDRFRVGRSRTGLGLFAVQRIGRGDFIIEYSGKRISSEDADKLNSKYLFDLANGLVIEGSDRSNIARYVNHSCSPNAAARIFRNSVRIYATKTIQPGDEITYNYGRSYFQRYLEPIGCKCAACSRPRRPRARRRASAR